MIVLELTQFDAELFKKFREYQEKFEILLKSGALDVKGGSVTIHYGEEGSIRKLEGNKILFYRT